MRLKRPTLESVTTINEDGSRYMVHPADVRGFWTTSRRLAAVLLFAIYFLLPVIPIQGNPAVFLDVAHRKFHFFGLTLMFQDLWMLFFLVTGLGFALFFLTAVVGRVWCGWACPQTVFLDHVVRRIERWVDGDAPARRALDAAPWSAEKLLRRVIKHGIFFLFATVIAHMFLSYFVSLPELWRMMATSPLENWKAFVFVFGMSGLLYFDFAWFREQFCIVLCPYGRLQSALLDDDSIVVGYDEKRGEPRGKPGTVTGDCVDCRRCVQVCPTGIDIRQGLQLECIACEACLDACDEVMVRLGRPKGLIRHDSMNALTGKPRRILRPRLLVYAVLGAIGGAVFFMAASQLRPAAITVTRMIGAPFIRQDGMIRNQFLVRVANKRPTPHVYRVQIAGGPRGLRSSGITSALLELPASSDLQEPLVVLFPDAEFRGGFDFDIELVGETGKVEGRQKLTFLGPYRESQP